MKHAWHFRTAAAIVAMSVAACAQAQAPQVVPAAPKHTAADTEFMQGMIGHHAQAIVMATMAPSHGASAQVSLFCKKVIISQRDEIDMMKTWLVDRGEKVPDPNAPHMMMPGHDMGSMMMMPGMLTDAQLKELDAARGTQFDRLFLTFMIQHHEGALTMVHKLFDSPGGGQGAEIFGYATGVDNDQRSEIERMEQMLKSIPGGTQ